MMYCVRARDAPELLGRRLRTAPSTPAPCVWSSASAVGDGKKLDFLTRRPLCSRGMAGTLTPEVLASIPDINGTNFLEAANAAGYGGSDMAAMLAGTRVPEGRISHFVELHIEQVLLPSPPPPPLL